MKVTLYGVHFADVPFPGNLAVLGKLFRDRGYQVKNLNGKYFRYRDKDEQIEPCDVAFVTGAQAGFGLIPAEYQKLGIPCFVFDLGWMRRDMGFNQLCLYGLNRPLSGNYPTDRLQNLGISLKPRRKGSRILLCGQKANDAQHDLGDLSNIINWSIDQMKKIRQITKQDIVLRPHPKSYFTTREADYLSNPKDESIEKCIEKYDISVALSYNSTSTIECIAAGVPVISLAKSSLYDDFTSKTVEDIKDPKFPSREEFEQFLAKLSYNQYTPAELSTGQPIDFVFEKVGVC